MKNEIKVYFNCKNQRQCPKCAFIKYEPGKKDSIGIFLSTSDHNHSSENTNIESKEAVIHFFKMGIFSYEEIKNLLEKNNLDKISYIQFYYLKKKFKLNKS